MRSVDIENLRKRALDEAEGIEDIKQLEFFRVKYLGRKGELTDILRSLKGLSLNERKNLGQAANKLRRELEEVVEFKHKELSAEGKDEFIDITRPGKKVAVGHLHPLTKIEDEIKEIFTSLNFSIVEGPELESEYYNFDALNIPPSHPARDMWDTFWIKSKIKNQKSKLLMRTHTSPMQIRYMETHKPPFQIIVPGRVFRYEATDASHEINFYQLEGLMVGENISLANFKFVIEAFFKRLFKEKIEFRFRPSYFPFVEPAVEVDIKFATKGRGEWLEVMGAGMVHPRVFEAAHLNPRDLQGFAFGVGIERLAMIKYKIPDIRMFYTGDLKFINQF
ncbi:MAG: phenylalanine--tRNA ligase subunit alpha [Parcubacteria group bacterium CG1_02_42_13]|nr:MAG: phenylalanine--tRNA ligase subunit alpha [Parcubacteria group bacterium CG1_02_42_13]